MHSAGEAIELLRSPDAAEDVAASMLAVDLQRASPADLEELGRLSPVLRSLPCVSVGVAARGGLHGAAWAAGFDVIFGDELGVDRELGVEQIGAAVRAHPQAAVAAAQVLRATAVLDVGPGLAVESAAYSMLQAGNEFRQWLQQRPPASSRQNHVGGAPVIAERDGDVLALTFNRPQARNAFDAPTRDALVELLRGAATDPTQPSIVLRGAGPSFCSGGDLNEFGTFPEPATAHQIRTTRSAAWWMASVGSRVRAELHGACVGAGIELAAWASDVVAAHDTFALLPEVSMGLIPGAGGTVSLPRRIGRHCTAYLAISGERADASRMLAWGLVDRLATLG